MNNSNEQKDITTQSPHCDEEINNDKTQAVVAEDQHSPAPTDVSPSLESEEVAPPTIVSVWGKTSSSATPDIRAIQLEELKVVEEASNFENKVVEFQRELEKESNFEVIPDSKVFVWQYHMKEEFYTMDSLKFEVCSNEYEDENLRKFISPWWYCTRPEARPVLPTLLPVLCQTHHWTYLGPMAHYTIQDLRGLIKRNQIGFAPRIKDDKVRDFTDFLKVKSLLDFNGEPISIFALARHAAYMMYDFNRRDSVSNLWNALSVYLGTLMYPFQYFYFTDEVATVLLSSNVYLWNELCNMGSNLLYGLSKCNSRFQPRYIMLNSWWGSQIIGFYGWATGDSRKRKPIKLEGRVSLLPSVHEAPVKPKELLDIRKAAKIIYNATDQDRPRIANSFIKKYGFDIDLLHSLVKSLDQSNGHFPPQTHMTAKQLFGRQFVPKRSQSAQPRSRSRQQEDTKQYNKSTPKSYENPRNNRRSQSPQRRRSQSVEPKRKSEVKRKLSAVHTPIFSFDKTTTNVEPAGPMREEGDPLPDPSKKVYTPYKGPRGSRNPSRPKQRNSSPLKPQYKPKQEVKRTPQNFKAHQPKVKTHVSQPLIPKRDESDEHKSQPLVPNMVDDDDEVPPPIGTSSPVVKPLDFEGIDEEEKPKNRTSKQVVSKKRTSAKPKIDKQNTSNDNVKQTGSNNRSVNQSVPKQEQHKEKLNIVNVIVDLKPIDKTVTAQFHSPIVPEFFLRTLLMKHGINMSANELTIVIGKSTYDGNSRVNVPISKDQRITVVAKGVGGSRLLHNQKQRTDTLWKIAERYAGHGVPTAVLVAANYEAGKKSNGVYNEDNVIAISKLAVKLAQLPDSPFPHKLTYFPNVKLQKTPAFIDSQFEEVPNCDWTQIPKSKVTDKQIELMKKIFPKRKRNHIWLATKNFDLKHKFEIFTKNPTTKEMYTAAFQILQDHTRQSNRFIGERYLNKAIVNDTEVGDDTHKVIIEVLYNGPSLIDEDGNLNLTNHFYGVYVPSARTNGHAKINYDMVGLLGRSVNTIASEFISVYDGLTDNSVKNYSKQQREVQRVVSENIKCPGTISGQLVRFAQCMFTRELACASGADPCWSNPVEKLRFYPLFDIRTLTPTKLGNLYITYPQVKVNMKASTGMFCNNQPRDLLCKISDGDLCAQWFTLMNNAIKNGDDEQLKQLQSLALVAEMKPKNEVFEREKMFYKTRTIYVLNSFTQVPLNVMFTGSENEFMSAAMNDPTEPVLLGIDPVLWIKQLITTLRDKPEVFEKQRFWYYSYSDNVYCLDVKELKLYSFDGTKMESAIRGEDVENLLSTLTNYVGVADFTVVGEQTVIEDSIHRTPQWDLPGLDAYQFNFKYTPTYCHTPFALDGGTFKISSYYDRLFLNRVIFYVKQGIPPFKYEEDTASFSVIGKCENYKSELWNTYVKTMGQLCENLPCYLGETMIKSHFLPSGAQFTSLVNTYKTLGSVLYANEKQINPDNFINIVKCWVVELENVADLKPIINKDHSIENIRLDFLGMDATCYLGFWSVILREGALYSGPCYGDYIAKQRDLRVLNNEFSMYCAALLNGAMNRPYFCTLLLQRLYYLSSRITLNKELIEQMSSDLCAGLEIDYGVEYFNKADFWPYFIRFAIDRLKLETYSGEDDLVDSICGILQPPRGELNPNVGTLEEEMLNKYPIKSTTDYMDIINQFIIDEDVVHKLTPGNARLMDRIATLAKLISDARDMYYSRVVELIAAATMNLIVDEPERSGILTTAFSEVLYT